MIKGLNYLVFFLLFLSFANFVFAENPPGPPEFSSEGNDLSEVEQDIQKTQDLVNSLPIDPSTGEFNISRIDAIKLNATKRIELINEYVQKWEASTWLVYVFGMTPEISWLFASVLYCFLALFTTLVLNADTSFSGFSEKWISYTVGIGSFLGLMLLRLIYWLGRGLYNIADYLINLLIPIGIVAFILAIAIFIVLIIFWPKVIAIIMKFVAQIMKFFSQVMKVLGLRDSAAGTLKTMRDVEQKKKEFDAYAKGMQGS